MGRKRTATIGTEEFQTRLDFSEGVPVSAFRSRRMGPGGWTAWSEWVQDRPDGEADEQDREERDG